jgi:HEPN domain-containing protein
MELLQIYAGAYWRMSGMIGQIITYLEAGSQGATLSDQVHSSVGSTLGELQKEVQRLELRGPSAQLQRILENIIDGTEDRVTYSVLRQRIGSLHERIIDDLNERIFLSIPPERTSFYRQPTPLFGDKVEKKFSQMSEDISEAGKCLALNRNTAAVFHLMRVMELAVQYFGAELGVALASEKNWQNILDEINKKIRALNHKLPETKTYAEAASHLYNVKVAWRNEVMHPKQTYTDEEANAIFSSVRTFVRDLVGLI